MRYFIGLILAGLLLSPVVTAGDINIRHVYAKSVEIDYLCNAENPDPYIKVWVAYYNDDFSTATSQSETPAICDGNSHIATIDLIGQLLTTREKVYVKVVLYKYPPPPSF
ncbi:MAG: hypothetical protein J3R72DRAFT_445813 [Linnemannia gamsii]|nr:MAG: hypothetical protein J3R72DRAFT_445813 [Linnemannia gamsii]